MMRTLISLALLLTACPARVEPKPPRDGLYAVTCKTDADCETGDVCRPDGICEAK